MLEIEFMIVREINSALGKVLPTHSGLWTLAGESCIPLGKLTPLSLDNSYPVGSVCTTSHVLRLSLSLYLMVKVTVRFGHSLFSLFLELRVILFCFSCKYLWAEIIYKCIYQKWIIRRSCKTKQKKKNNLKFLFENELYWFLKLACNRRFCTKRLTL